MIGPILTIVASIASIIGAYYLQKTIRNWVQRWDTAQTTKAGTDAIKQTEDTVKTIDQQHQSLKDIEGR